MVITNTNWNYFYDKDFPWVQSFFDVIVSASIPTLMGPTIYITSDYSGDNKKSSFQIFSFLLADIAGSHHWQERRQEVRKSHLTNRKMGYKYLNDTQRKKAIVPFLCAANELSGLCVSIAINKKIQNLYANLKTYKQMKKHELLKASWKISSLEKMFRVTHLLSLLISGVAKPNQNIYWISDNDSILASPLHKMDTAKVMSSFASKYIPFKLGELGIGTTDIDEGDFVEEDLSAIPDLISGALADFFTGLQKELGSPLISQSSYDSPTNIKPKSEIILDWLRHNKSTLKRIVIALDCNDNGKFKVGRLFFDTSHLGEANV